MAKNSPWIIGCSFPEKMCVGLACLSVFILQLHSKWLSKLNLFSSRATKVVLLSGLVWVGILYAPNLMVLVFQVFRPHDGKPSGHGLPEEVPLKRTIFREYLLTAFVGLQNRFWTRLLIHENLCQTTFLLQSKCWETKSTIRPLCVDYWLWSSSYHLPVSVAHPRSPQASGWFREGLSMKLRSRCWRKNGA